MNAKHEETLSGQPVIGPIYEPTSSLKRSKRATPSWFAGSKWLHISCWPAFSSTMIQKTLCTLTRLPKSRSCSYTCHEGIEVKLTQAPVISTPTQIGGEESASRLGRFTQSPSYPLNRRLGTPNSQSGHFGKKSNFLTRRDINPGSFSPQPSQYTDYATSGLLGSVN